MKVMTILGTRPEIIRLSLIIPKLDAILGKDHFVFWSGQNPSDNLSNIFFKEFGYRNLDYYCDMAGKSFSLGTQLGNLFETLERVIDREKPDKFFVLGDTNTSLSALLAKRMGVKVYHMEAGNRCHNPESPEEVNRHVIDHVSDVHMPYSENSRRNLLAEGIPGSRIFVVGNPMCEVFHELKISSEFTERYNIIEEDGLQEKEYYVSTIHRQENVDNHERLTNIMYNLMRLDKPVVLSVHPRLLNKLEQQRLDDYMEWRQNMILKDAMGFKQWIALMSLSAGIITDSGTVQEEGAIFQRPTVVLRDATERPECIEAGSGLVLGLNHVGRLQEALRAAGGLNSPDFTPPEYDKPTSDIVTRIILGHQV
jgi:UDP-N-acetylglucosamine 2-epimerase (non-hydrolysing)